MLGHMAMGSRADLNLCFQTPSDSLPNVHSVVESSEVWGWVIMDSTERQWSVPQYPRLSPPQD